MTISQRATAMMPEREQPLSELYRIAGEEWADAHAAAGVLEETKSADLSRRIIAHIKAHGPMPFNRAEAEIKGSDDWIAHCQHIIELRKNADKLRIRMKSIEIRFTEWVNANANNRHEARLGR